MPTNLLVKGGYWYIYIYYSIIKFDVIDVANIILFCTGFYQYSLDGVFRIFKVNYRFLLI